MENVTERQLFQLIVSIEHGRKTLLIAAVVAHDADGTDKNKIPQTTIRTVVGLLHSLSVTPVYFEISI